MKQTWGIGLLVLVVGFVAPSWARPVTTVGAYQVAQVADDDQPTPEEIHASFIVAFSYLDWCRHHPGSGSSTEMGQSLGNLKQAWDQAKAAKMDTAHVRFKPVHVLGTDLASAQDIIGAKELTFDQAYAYVPVFERMAKAAGASEDAEAAAAKAKWEKALTGDRLRIFQTEGYPERFNGNTMSADESDEALAEAVKSKKWQYTKGSGSLLYHIYYLFDGDTLSDTQRVVVETP